MQLVLLLLFLFLFSGYVVALTSKGKGDMQHSAPLNAAETADSADRDLVTFNRTVASAVLIVGCLFVIYYCIRRSNKTCTRRKTDGRTARQERP